MNFLGKLLRGIAFIPQIVFGIEAFHGAKGGEQKQSAAMSFIGMALGVTEAIAAKDIVDEKGFQEGMKQMIDGAVKCMNASVWYKR